MLLLINEWAQRSNFTFITRELLEQSELFMINDKFIYRNYWDMANKQLNMLVKHRVLIKEKGKGQANRYSTRPVHVLEDEYKKEKTPKHTHQAPHIFNRMYWESRKNLE